MDKLAILNKIKSLYDNNINIINYLKEVNGKNLNSLEDIMISYDFQAGSYIKEYKLNPKWKNDFVKKLGDFISTNVEPGGDFIRGGYW